VTTIRLDSMLIILAIKSSRIINVYHFPVGSRKAEQELQENILGSVEGNIMECELGKLLIERAPHPENILSCHVGIDHRCLEILMA
jgi:hypothetical protein